jgi:hypothetical protein
MAHCLWWRRHCVGRVRFEVQKVKEFGGSAVGRVSTKSSASKPEASLLPDTDLQSLYSEQHIRGYQGLFVFIADSRK